MISFGPRATLGFFLTPMSQANGWGRDVFGLALAIQNILWGIGQPFAGAIADRFGTMRVLCAGGAFYAIGLILMAYSTSPAMLNLAAGVFIGFGLAGCSFSVVLAAFGKLLPERWRLLAFGAGTAAGSFGQFLYSPVAISLMDAFGWQTTLMVFGVGMLLVLPLSLAIATAPAEAGAAHGAAPQSLRQALSEAVGHRSYVLLVLGFFTCGFQLAFITVHMPAYLVDRGLSAQVGGWTIAVISFIYSASTFSPTRSSRPLELLSGMLARGRTEPLATAKSYPLSACSDSSIPAASCSVPSLSPMVYFRISARISVTIPE